ncbi:MAG TPA: thioredoxin domain-containing protein, partial [Anaerolineales bacterium]|nr:thioredoxin domain-containing protein [Anaerolineales bacterium]
MPNKLVHENSPYLLQHANNPVDWYPWSDEALTKARLENKPIFLSIGYAACHWCHVMEHESFEDAETAAIMNEHFICIKVDREERPDLDSIYMQATTAMTGSGGWPMSVFLTPDLQPFYTGTYFPPVRRYNMPAFKDVLLNLARAWREDRDEITRVGNQVVEYIQPQSQASESGKMLSPQHPEAAVNSLLDSYDWSNGGWGNAPKFPQPMTIEFLLRRALNDLTQREQILKFCVHVLDAMSRGGMYDVVGGGFARYSVDNFWRVPHFEKMLYDNAQLALVYLHGYLVTRDIRYRQTCEETLDFILREMTHPAGGFYSSLDADSEGEEGKFYIWTLDEIQDVLSSDFEFFKAAYGMTSQGNWEGKIVLQRTLDDSTLAARFKLDPDLVRQKLTESHRQLLQVRNRRIRPGTDDKILVMWNSLMLSAFAQAGRALNRKDYLDAAVRNARFLLDNLYINDRLLRSWRDGQAKHNAYLEDYAGLILGLMDLYQSDFNPDWFEKASRLADEMVEHFSDPTGGFFDTRHDHETLLVRPKDMQDNATPSGNAMACEALLKLAAFTDEGRYRDLAETALGQVADFSARYPTSFGRWLSAADFALANVKQVAVVYEPGAENVQEILNLIQTEYRPNLVLAAATVPPPANSPSL